MMAAALIRPGAAAPIFSKDIAPIIEKHCVHCHRPGGIGWPIDFTSYPAIRPWAKAIRQAVVQKYMPPWLADPGKSLKFRNDARLSSQQIATLTAWVDAGAPGRGSLTVPASNGGWDHPQGRAPDLVISMERELRIPPSGDIPYLRLLVKLPEAEDRWISAVQARPGNASVVHHMAITEVGLDDGVLASDLEGFALLARQMGAAGPVSPMGPVVKTPGRGEMFDMLGIYTPGAALETYPGDTGKLLKGGRNKYLNFNIHYASNGKPAADRSEVALWFRPTPPKEQIFRVPLAYDTILAEGVELLTDAPGVKAEGTRAGIPPIPPGSANYELTAVTAFTRPVTIYQLHPHAHLRGKDFQYAAVFPDGREETLLSIPKYDFRWQLAYELETPLALPAGSKMVITAHYDNSVNNRFNPAPEKQVYFRAQNQASDEMFSPFVQYSVARSAADLPVVEVSGCLASAGQSSAWILSNLSLPVPSQQAATSSARAPVQPGGGRQIELVGTRVFQPSKYEGQAVVVRGVVVDSRLSVTSLRPATPAIACSAN